MTTSMTTPTFDPAHFRRVLAHFPTGVVVVTAIDDGDPVGLAVGSFTSVSLHPPMIGFFPAKSSTTWPRIEKAGAFVVNVLGEYQENVCRTFAKSGGEKFGEVSWRRAPSGGPILDDVTAWIECDLKDVVDTGDHWFVLGQVRDLATCPSRSMSPLVFFQGQYARLS